MHSCKAIIHYYKSVQWALRTCHRNPSFQAVGLAGFGNSCGMLHVHCCTSHSWEQPVSQTVRNGFFYDTFSPLFGLAIEVSPAFTPHIHTWNIARHIHTCTHMYTQNIQESCYTLYKYVAKIESFTCASKNFFGGCVFSCETSHLVSLSVANCWVSYTLEGRQCSYCTILSLRGQQAKKSNLCLSSGKWGRGTCSTSGPGDLWGLDFSVCKCSPPMVHKTKHL